MSEDFHISTNIQKYVDLGADEIKALNDIIKLSRVKKKDRIVVPGKVCRYQTYVVKGLLRSYLLADNGSEHTIQFAAEDWFISDFNSYINQTEASLFVEALEDSMIQQIEYNAVEGLCKEYPVFERYFRLVAQKAFAFSQKRVLSNLKESAEQRYTKFSQQYPGIARRVPQYTLASYLGMSQEFLSKIRSRKT